jgi:hypothetical protein
MCNFENGIKLCTCSSENIKFREPNIFIRKKGKTIEKENSKNLNIPLEYIWILFKYDGIKKDKEMGRYMFPADDLGKGLNSEWIALNLNCENCFDFEYIPKEGDNLKIQKNTIMSSYLSFIYRNEEWVVDHHSPWRIKISKIKSGKIKTP